jgi:hypothetical protein
MIQGPGVKKLLHEFQRALFFKKKSKFHLKVSKLGEKLLKIDNNKL